jgi:uncharacterized membrane protein
MNPTVNEPVDAMNQPSNHAAANVGIVIVSHSPKIAEGTADMVRQMVGDSVPLAYTGGNLGSLVGGRRSCPRRSRRGRNQQ